MSIRTICILSASFSDTTCSRLVTITLLNKWSPNPIHSESVILYRTDHLMLIMPERMIYPILPQESFITLIITAKTRIPKTLCKKFSAKTVSSVLIRKYSKTLAMQHTRKTNRQIPVAFKNRYLFIFDTFHYCSVNHTRTVTADKLL